MITKTSLTIGVVAALCFGGSFIGTVATRSRATPPAVEPQPLPPLARQIGLDAEQARVLDAKDPQFAADLQALRDELEKARSELAAAFDDPNTTDDEIRRRIEAVIEAHNRVERRVGEYLITVRDQLTPEQQKRLFGLCAEKVRERGKRWRHGRAHGRESGIENDNTSEHAPGAGQGHGEGQGRGKGRRWRGGAGRND
jgi:Spy/CpxP family protein refolding chaperone